jgi:hypothetical protein
VLAAGNPHAGDPAAASAATAYWVFSVACAHVLDWVSLQRHTGSGHADSQNQSKCWCKIVNARHVDIGANSIEHTKK